MVLCCLRQFFVDLTRQLHAFTCGLEKTDGRRGDRQQHRIDTVPVHDLERALRRPIRYRVSAVERQQTGVRQCLPVARGQAVRVNVDQATAARPIVVMMLDQGMVSLLVYAPAGPVSSSDTPDQTFTSRPHLADSRRSALGNQTLELTFALILLRNAR